MNIKPSSVEDRVLELIQDLYPDPSQVTLDTVLISLDFTFDDLLLVVDCLELTFGSFYVLQPYATIRDIATFYRHSK